jgi:hypothetical protein
MNSTNSKTKVAPLPDFALKMNVESQNASALGSTDNNRD